MRATSIGTPTPRSERALPSSRLFTPGRIGNVELKNRVVMPSMTSRNADREGHVTDNTIAYFCARADGGVGLITVEMASPEKAGRHRNFELGIYDDRFLPGLTRLVEALHERGSKVSIQLGHGGGHTRSDINGGEPPVAPSAIPHVVEEGTTETIIPEAMSRERIKKAVEAFAQAAARARRAGFDMVEVHAAHGYLLSQFLCPGENQRDDEYGGTLENRARFALEVVRRIKKTSPGLPVIFRLSGDDFFPGGMPFAEARQVAIWAAQVGADAIHVAGGHYRSLPTAARMIPPMALPDATFLHFAANIRTLVTVPVISVGRLGNPADATRAVDEGHADFVALGRPLLADPEWVNKVMRGEPVRMCIACNTCINGMRAGSRLHCLVNPITGRERLYGDVKTREARLPQGRRIAVVGAGPAGLSYASLVAPGNKVTVFEKEESAGGSFRLAGLAPKFQEVDAAPGPLLRYIAELERACRKGGVKFHFDCDVAKSPEVLAGFDQIVVASGSTYRTGLGLIPLLLRADFARLPVMRTIAKNPKVRNWFYHQARVPTGESIGARLAARKVSLIGDAVTPGKSEAAILSAFEAAFGVSEQS
jgi:2,4-dienoyl-CoA reductase-like NADH-dependent reductase (Old Yellow Enzyme family)